MFAGRYRIEGALGCGGGSFVYRAFDLAAAHHVALKVLAYTDAASRARFEREAEITFGLSHPHVVRALASGEGEGGRCFIAYELLHGETLKARLRRLGPEAWQSVAHFACQILSALSAAHDSGVIHRDIKPSNVFVCTDASGRGFVKLLDFGICKPPGSMQLTLKGDVLGTPRYMSPEQLSPGPLSPASDLFSLGLVLAELLMGRPVYGGNAGESMIARVAPEPTPLGAEVFASPLAAVISRATEKLPTRRYASADEMLLDLFAALEDDPLETSGVYEKPDSAPDSRSFEDDDTVRISA